MEHVAISFNNPELFDKYLNENRKADMPECGDLEIVTKCDATEAGKSIAMITFTVARGKKRKRVQAVTTLQNLVMLLSAAKGRMEFEAENQTSGTRQ